MVKYVFHGIEIMCVSTLAARFVDEMPHVTKTMLCLRRAVPFHRYAI